MRITSLGRNQSFCSKVWRCGGRVACTAQTDLAAVVFHHKVLCVGSLRAYQACVARLDCVHNRLADVACGNGHLQVLHCRGRLEHQIPVVAGNFVYRAVNLVGQHIVGVARVCFVGHRCVVAVRAKSLGQLRRTLKHVALVRHKKALHVCTDKGLAARHQLAVVLNVHHVHAQRCLPHRCAVVLDGDGKICRTNPACTWLNFAKVCQHCRVA